MRLHAAFLSLALAAMPALPAFAQFEGYSYERALYRTIASVYQTAPPETVAEATRCILVATADLPQDFRANVVAIDVRRVRGGTNRLNALVDALALIDPAKTKPVVECFGRIAKGDFGATTGSVVATSVPRPSDVEACPSMIGKQTASPTTCYCPALAGGIVYGDKTYADTSSFCLAAQHAGATDPLAGGVVTAFIEPGCAAYEGVETNGSLSAASGRTARSFSFASAGRGKCPK